ncbi:dolichyl-P-Man:Man(7)GlcNAc(2)-PP-dolichol alpha-1,6-mannosyltransferase Ecym_2496 [Eremothecium cymbalariae DBVPG|uniref:Mannosyltransferase n=1 Tax=Eremothecium cymbalariae (strain CBS 270.75 / DBVPG 7215 / KCTC 17166 / NRRL Y-17582) TaxID=931890 RepID=G8JPW0_ERECY|nr:Hypothetical protein Ecym_2496 [Eremothecium cymbalariae DBVPG\
MRQSLLNFTLILVVVIGHLILSPYTKVEESFTIQAIHDILKYGILDISKYDHIKFSGVVPRTFVGPLIIALLTKPFSWIMEMLLWIMKGDSLDGMNWLLQYISRGIIGLLNALALNILNETASRVLLETQQTNSKTNIKTWTSRNWFVLFLVTQFHMMYYASRPLPNFVVTLPLSNIGLSWALEESYEAAIALLSFTAIVFRLELGVLCFGIAFWSYVYKKVTIKNIAKFGLIGLGIGIMLSSIIDSYFWQTCCVPEISAFVFNVIDGQSSNWGTEPFMAYISTYLPKIFLLPTFLLFGGLGFKVAPRSFRIILLASILHIFGLSLQPHKEWRFIIYTIPSITLLCSTGVASLNSKFDLQSIQNSLVSSMLLISVVIPLAASLGFSFVSSMNYPGGEALASFNDYVLCNNISNATVHLDVPTCMSGATLFGQLPEKFNITYDKTEDYTLESMWPSFDYAIMLNSAPEPLLVSTSCSWELLRSSEDLNAEQALVSTIDTSLRSAIRAIYEFQFKRLFSLMRIVAKKFLHNGDWYIYKQTCHNPNPQHIDK